MECAHLVFQDFIVAYEDHLGSDSVWSLSNDGEDEAITGFTAREWDIGAAILEQKGLISRLSMESWKLTRIGAEVCLNPAFLEQFLGSRPASLPQPLPVRARSAGSATVSYKVLLAEAARAAEGRNDIRPAVASALRVLRDHGGIEKLLTEAEQALLAKP
jgi:hypothetical protein